METLTGCSFHDIKGSVANLQMWPITYIYIYDSAERSWLDTVVTFQDHFHFKYPVWLTTSNRHNLKKELKAWTAASSLLRSISVLEMDQFSIISSVKKCEVELGMYFNKYCGLNSQASVLWNCNFTTHVSSSSRATAAIDCSRTANMPDSEWVQKCLPL